MTIIRTFCPKTLHKGLLFIHSNIYYLSTLCPALWSGTPMNGEPYVPEIGTCLNKSDPRILFPISCLSHSTCCFGQSICSSGFQPLTGLHCSCPTGLWTSDSTSLSASPKHTRATLSNLPLK